MNSVIRNSIPAESNAAKLRELMSKHDLSRADVADLLKLPTVTVGAWLATAGSAKHRQMPDQMLRLVMLELRESRPARKLTRRREARRRVSATQGALPGVPASSPKSPRPPRASQSRAKEAAAPEPGTEP